MMNMEATIIISEREEKAGTGKNGKPYVLTTLISNNGNKYSGFRIDKDIQPGYSVKLMAKESKFKNNYDIERVIEYDANPNSVSQTQPAGQGQIVSTPPKPLPAKPLEKALPKLTAELQRKWMVDAQIALSQRHGADFDMMVYASVYAELIRQYFSVWISERITAEQRARWGK